MPAILTDATAAYLASMEPHADELVIEMEDHAATDNIPIANRSVAGLQAIFARAMSADRALEVGTAIGYSMLYVARTGTDVVTLEIDPDRIEAAVSYLERDDVSVRVTDDPASIDVEPTGDGNVVIVEGPAVETIPALTGPFDLVFLDAIKAEYNEYLAESLPLISKDGVVIADNLLRGGNVPADDANIEDGYEASAKALRAFNDTFIGHEQLDAIISPQGDGTGIAVKRK